MLLECNALFKKVTNDPMILTILWVINLACFFGAF